MARYRLYYLRDNVLIGSDDIEAADDREAARLAKQRGRGQRVEIWDSVKRVNVVAPAGGRGAPSERGFSEPGAPARS